jgi:cold shock CspA family protein
MGRSHESFSKKDVKNKKDKKRKEKEKKRLARKETGKSSKLEDMIAYVDEYGMITSESPDPNKKADTDLSDIQISIPKREAMSDFDPIRTGTVTFFDTSKGFGFIKDSQTKQDVFAHVSSLLEEIREGNQVTFEVESGKKGPVAVRVKLLK